MTTVLFSVFDFKVFSMQVAWSVQRQVRRCWGKVPGLVSVFSFLLSAGSDGTWDGKVLLCKVEVT